MKRVSVITNFNIPGKAAVAEKVIQKFLECGAEVAAPYYAKGRVDCRIPVLMPGAKLYDNADIIVVIGGDGSYRGAEKLHRFENEIAVAVCKSDDVLLTLKLFKIVFKPR